MGLSEDDLQMAVFAWARTLVPKHPELASMFHIPNGGKRDAQTASKLVKLGVVAGVPDIALAVPSRGYHGLFYELKRPDGKGKVSQEQKSFMAGLEERGYCVFVGCDFGEIKTNILWYLGA